MKTRLLPPEEWHRLRDTEAWPFADGPAPATTQIVVVEDGGEIVGCHVLFAVVHAECLWIRPDRRGKAGVARRLWAGVQRTVRECFEAESIVTSATDDRIRGLLRHVGARRLEGESYVIPLEGPCPPQSPSH